MQVSNRFIVRSTFGFLLVGFLALLGIVGMTFWLGERAQIYFTEVIAARDTRGSAVELRNALQTAESSQRGFVLTGNEIYLAPYDTAKTLALRQLESLRRLLAPDRSFDVPIQRLTSIISEKFEEMDQTIGLKRARRDAEAFAIVRSNRGKALTDEANIYFTGIIRAADDRLTTGVGEQRANANWLRTFSLIGGIIIVLVVGSAALSILRYTRELREARDEVGALNAELEERVRARTADLALANEEIKRFAYIVTHDLRAPLVSIIGFTAEIAGGVKEIRALTDRADIRALDDAVTTQARTAAAQDLPEAVGFIRSSARKMESLIQAILKLSREGRRTLRPEPLDLAEVVEASIEAIQHQVSAADGTVSLAIDVPPIVGDRLSLEQILGNLFDNAVKYRASGRPLRIGVRAGVAPGDRFVIEVADNGRGIAEADRHHIFDLFRRAGEADQPGEGIGLAYVRTMVRNLGGDIGVTSVLGEGTTFRLVLPRNLHVPEAPAATG